MLDSAVTWFGVTIENALSERDKYGTGSSTEYRPRYTLSLLLDDNFKLPRPPMPKKEKAGLNPWLPLLSWLGKSKAVRKYQYVKPVDGEVSDG